MTDHTCHHPHCDVSVPPKMLACRRHWYALPPPLRAAIWATYRPGQEVAKAVSDDYLEAFADCQAFWLDTWEPLR